MIIDMYQYLKPFPDFQIFCHPQEEPQRVVIGANEPQLLHLRGCHLEFKHNIIKYCMLHYNLNYVYVFIVMENSSVITKCVILN